MKSLEKMAVLLFLTILVSCGQSVDGPTDLKEYGFKGEVKTIVSKRYVGISKKNGEWEYSKDDLFAISIYHFNKEENIETLEMTHFYEGDTLENTFHFSFTNGRKTGATRVSDGGKNTLEMTFEWKGDRKYIWKSTENNIYSETISELDENYRDKEGIFNAYSNDELVTSETYINFFDDEGQITKSRLIDHINETTRVQLYKDKVYDSVGNMLEVAIVDSASGKLEVLTVREYTYY